MSTHGPILVIKFGGNAMTSPELFTSFAQDITSLRDKDFASLFRMAADRKSPRC